MQMSITCSFLIETILLKVISFNYVLNFDHIDPEHSTMYNDYF